ncbi:MAG: transposase [Bdellovibrionota bacterium]
MEDNISAQDKVLILKKHLLDGVPISELCKEYEIDVQDFYKWQKVLFEQGSKVFKNKTKQDRLEKKIDKLEEKIAKREDAIAELQKANKALREIQFNDIILGQGL